MSLMSIICNLQNINLAFGQKTIFKDTKITINEGDQIGLIGLNGYGKSTLFNILVDKVTPDISTPSFVFDKNKEKFKPFLIPQELDVESYPELSINNFYLSFYPELYEVHKKLEVLSERLVEEYENEKLLEQQQQLLEEFESLGGWSIESSYLSYLSYFDLSEKDVPVIRLSGGEQRKMALSIGLSTPALLILWDEPTNHLDIETIERFEDELNSSNKTYMIISHDRYLLNHVTNRIIHIERGDINSFKGTYLQYLEYIIEREKEREKHLDKLQNRHRRELAWMRQGVKARGTRSKKRVEGFNNINTDIQALKDKSRRTVSLNLTHTGRKSKKMVELENVKFGFENDVLFNDLSISLCKGDKIALIGPNGAGKSTLIKLLAGQIAIAKGKRTAIDELKVVVFDQKRESLELDKTPFEVVGEGQDFVHFDNGERKHVSSYLEDFLFPRDQIVRPIHTLSGGEKNRLQLAIFMKQSADLWVFDEPTNDLDIETIEILENELADYKAAVLIIGHDRAFLDNICKKTWLLHDKDIEEFEGGYSQVAPYLHALEMEKKLKGSKVTQDTPKPVVEKSQSKKELMSYKEKLRWKEIEGDIASLEEKIEKIKLKLSSFDYASSPAKDLEKLNAKYQEHETKLENLMSEWSDLSEKEV